MCILALRRLAVMTAILGAPWAQAQDAPPPLVTGGHAHRGHGAPAGSQGTHVPSWTEAPLLTLRGGGMGSSSVIPSGFTPAQITLHSPGGAVPEPLPVDVGKPIPLPLRRGGYHRIVAVEEHPGHTRVVATHLYGNQGPADHRALFARSLAALEIVPLELPRDHAIYQEGRRTAFLVRFRGQPLTDTPLALRTAAGSRSELRTDGRGVVELTFPRDLRAAGPSGWHGERPRVMGDFQLVVSHESAGHRYESFYNQRYGTAPDFLRSTPYGWAALGFGGLLGFVVLRPRQRPRKGAVK